MMPMSIPIVTIGANTSKASDKLSFFDVFANTGDNIRFANVVFFCFLSIEMNDTRIEKTAPDHRSRDCLAVQSRRHPLPAPFFQHDCRKQQNNGNNCENTGVRRPRISGMKSVLKGLDEIPARNTPSAVSL